MSKEAFEQANEAFVDEKYRQAYEVGFETNFVCFIPIKTLSSSFIQELL
jgi:hypothetical protein